MKELMSRIAVSGVFVVAFLCFNSTSAEAQQNEVPKVEVGPLFAFTRLNESDQNGFGLGGRLTLNPGKNIGFDVEVNHYPNAERIGTTTLAGLKLTGLRNEHVALFGKVVAGFTWRRSRTRLPGIFDLDFTTSFGGGFEVFASKKVGVRFDAGDLWIHNTGHNLNITTGVTFRF